MFIRPTPQEEIILALPDITLSSAPTTEAADLTGILNQVLWDDLNFAGYFTIAVRSFYPTQKIGTWRNLDFEAWRDLKVSYLSTGTLNLNGGRISIQFQLIDMKRRSLAFSLEVSGDKSNIRDLAHRWADEMVFNLTAGASRGIASTKIAFTSKHGEQKEIDVMDYDGNAPRAFISNGLMNLFPVWSPDNSKIAFIGYRTEHWELYIYSYIDGSRLPFPIFNSTASTPSFSPDGKHLAFALRSLRGDTDIFISKIDGSDRTNITNNPFIDTSPTWSPSGNQLAFASDRDGKSKKIFTCDADGTNVRIFSKEEGEADSPAWSPDGRWIAFHWKPRRSDHFDIYIGEVASGRILQLTNSAGNNWHPSWAPDGRHIAFDSDRDGNREIYVMLLGDPSNTRKITSRGEESRFPAWGGYPTK